jgi:predicted GH43/DUF377 family glycosyl hydrolase
MKYAVAFVCLLLLSCADNGVKVNEESVAGSAGKLSFSLSKIGMPQNISTLTFTLTNLSTAETVSKVVVVSTDTTITVVFDKIAAGQWHVQVIASEAAGGKQYGGGSDVTVTQGQVTQLNLFLTLSAGTGTLMVMVAWESTAIFFDSPANPILVKRGAWYDVRGVENPTVLYDNGKYKMWFLNYGVLNGPYGSIGLAESVDGTTWMRVADTVLMPTPNGWDGALVAPGTVLKENGIYTMYYTGQNPAGTGHAIGVAQSQDGQHWTKIKKILPDVQNIVQTGVVKVNNLYYLYYHTAPSYALHLATSADGMNWQTYAGNPVLTPNQPWEGNALAYGSVIYENNIFTMLYVNTASSQSFGMATSTDGIHWSKDARNPVFSKANTVNGWATTSIGYPFLVRVGNELRIYYTGITNDGIDRIGFAVKR